MLTKESVFFRVIFMTLILSAAAVAGAAAANEAEYRREGARPIECFMADGEFFSNSELHQFQQIFDQHSQNINHPDFTVLGGQLYQAHQAEIDAWLAEMYQTLEEQLPRYTKEDIEAWRVNSPMMDFRYLRILSRTWVVVAQYLAAEGRSEDALKIRLALIRFGHSIFRGDGKMPLLIDSMIALAIQRIVLNPDLINDLERADLSRERYQWVARLLRETADSQSVIEPLTGERHSLNSIIIYELAQGMENAEANNSDSEYSGLLPLMKSDPDFDQAEARQRMIKIIRERVEENSLQMLEMMKENEFRPRQMRRFSEEYFNQLAQRSEVTPWTFLTLTPEKIPEMVADILLNIAMPNFSRAGELVLETRMLLFGAAALTELMADSAAVAGDERKSYWLIESESLSAAGVDYYSESLPADPASAADEGVELKPLRYISTKTGFVLYSRGKDGEDNGGDREQDLILYSR